MDTHGSMVSLFISDTVFTGQSYNCSNVLLV